MGTVNEGINKIAMIIIILLLLVYFTGFATDAKAVTSAFTGIIGALLPRNAAGNFAGYPSGGGAGAAAQNSTPAGRA